MVGSSRRPSSIPAWRKKKLCGSGGRGLPEHVEGGASRNTTPRIRREGPPGTRGPPKMTTRTPGTRSEVLLARALHQEADVAAPVSRPRRRIPLPRLQDATLPGESREVLSCRHMKKAAVTTWVRGWRRCCVVSRLARDGGGGVRLARRRRPGRGTGLGRANNESRHLKGRATRRQPPQHKQLPDNRPPPCVASSRSPSAGEACWSPTSDMSATLYSPTRFFFAPQKTRSRNCGLHRPRRHRRPHLRHTTVTNLLRTFYFPQD